MRSPKRASGGGWFALAAIVLMALTACEPPRVVIPEGATNVVHVHPRPDNLQLDPAKVKAGVVYFVIEGPGTDFSLVRRKPAPDADATSMSAAQIEAVRHGDYQSTQLESYAVSCAPDSWTEERHWEGCRENSMVSLAPGLYAVVQGPDEPGVAPIMAVLEVEP